MLSPRKQEFQEFLNKYESLCKEYMTHVSKKVEVRDYKGKVIFTHEIVE